MSNLSNVIGPISMNDFRLMTLLRGSLQRFKELGNPLKYTVVIEKEQEMLKELMDKYTKPTATEELAEAA